VLSQVKELLRHPGNGRDRSPLPAEDACLRSKAVPR
jgi:hypothetical protein